MNAVWEDLSSFCIVVMVVIGSIGTAFNSEGGFVVLMVGALAWAIRSFISGTS